MNERKDAIKRIVIYLAIATLFSAVIDFLIISAGSIEAGGGFLTFLLMWVPGISGLIATLAVQGNLKGLFTRTKPTWLLAAYLLPLGYTGIVYGAAWMSGLAGFTTDAIPEGMGVGVFVISQAIIGPVMALISAAGEEIGWRGVLLPQLAKIMSPVKASLVSGAIWVLWHAPVVFLADYNGGPSVWFGFICFTVMTMGLTFAFTWLRLKSGSVWPAVMLHASHNAFIQLIADLLTVQDGTALFVTGEFGMGLAVAGIIIGFVFMRMLRAGEDGGKPRKAKRGRARAESGE